MLYCRLVRPAHGIVALTLLGMAASGCARRELPQVLRTGDTELPSGSHGDRDASRAIDLAFSPYADTIRQVSAREGVDPVIVWAVIHVESAFQPHARSDKGAMGLMQLMPATARRYAVDDAYNPVANIEAGVKHLRALLEQYPLALALAAYNAGADAVDRFHGIPPFPETQAYVSRVLEVIAQYGGDVPLAYRAAVVRPPRRFSFGAPAEGGPALPLRPATGPWRAARPLPPGR